jgi:hypothetical protein
LPRRQPAGALVTVLETEELVLSRVTSARSPTLCGAHRRHGVETECTAQVIAFEAGERLEAAFARTVC